VQLGCSSYTDAAVAARQAAANLLQKITADASVAASTLLVPHLAQREVLVALPHGIDYRDRTGQERRSIGLRISN